MKTQEIMEIVNNDIRIYLEPFLALINTVKRMIIGKYSFSTHSTDHEKTESALK